MLIGYARISTSDQSLSLQIDCLNEAGCQKIFTDTLSGNKALRPGLEQALAFARQGDTLVVWKLDRLGRSLTHLLQLMETLQKKEVAFKSLSDAIDTSTPMGKMVFAIFGSLAEFELSLMKERTMAGLKAARARGKNGGRKNSLNCEEVSSMLTLYESKKHSVVDICRQMKISRKSFYNYLKRNQKDQYDLIP